MELLSHSRPQSNTATKLLISFMGACCCFALFVCIAEFFDLFVISIKFYRTVDCIDISLLSFLGLLIPFTLTVILHLTGLVIWLVKGEEIIQYDENNLYIVNKGRIIGKSKKIPWSNIKNTEVGGRTCFEPFINLTNNADNVFRLRITRYKGREIDCGLNLSQEECERVITTVRELMK
jgi:hypothetical protein